MVVDSNNIGYLTIITGPMASGKSGDLIKFCKEAQTYGRKAVAAFKPNIDNRFSVNESVSRIGLKFPSINLPTDLNSFDYKRFFSEFMNNDIFAFDEVQLYNSGIIPVINYILSKKKIVVAAGLNLDYRGESFGSVKDLMCIADEVVLKKAYCAVCGKPAVYTQRIKDGKPFTKKLNTNIQIGSDEYQPRCRNCFVHPDDD